MGESSFSVKSSGIVCIFWSVNHSRFQAFISLPIGSMYGIYANIWGILMVNVTIYSIHGSYGLVMVSYWLVIFQLPLVLRPRGPGAHLVGSPSTPLMCCPRDVASGFEALHFSSISEWFPTFGGIDLMAQVMPCPQVHLPQTALIGSGSWCLGSWSAPMASSRRYPETSSYQQWAPIFDCG